jgi:hypothetical protein
MAVKHERLGTTTDAAELSADENLAGLRRRQAFVSNFTMTGARHPECTRWW